MNGGHGAKSAFAHPTANLVIASEAKQSSATRAALDCFGALRLAMTVEGAERAC
jgi:hypothetical protein